MTHSAIHFTVGAAAATLLCTPGLIQRLRAKRALAQPLLRWLLLCYGLGLYAVAPAILRHLGIGPSVTGHWGMNLFLLHPLLSRLHLGGTIVATACLGALFAFQYAVLVAAVRRTELTTKTNRSTV